MSDTQVEDLLRISALQVLAALVRRYGQRYLHARAARRAPDERGWVTME
ncbi:hypothetical protein [Nocardia sp. NPDC004604]